MDSAASATQKADPTGYIAKSRELAERKLASLYLGMIRTQAIGGPKAPIDPVAMVILLLARKAFKRQGQRTRRSLERRPPCAAE
jgi:hypothetical protein